MRAEHERGQSLVEVVVSVGLVAVTLGAVTTAAIVATHRSGPDPVQTALQQIVERESRIAVDLLKYQGGTIVPTTVATAVPLPSGSPLAAHVSVSVSPLPGGGQSVQLHAVSDADPTKQVTLITTIANPAPLPSSSVSASGTAPAPTGAP